MVSLRPPRTFPIWTPIERTDLSITVYSQPGCYPCKGTIRTLTNAGVDHTVVDISVDTEAYQAVQAMGYQQTPVVVAGDQHWSGHSPTRLAALLR